MKGASGAGLTLSGDLVEKVCKDAQEQVRWFELAKPLLPSGVTTPRVWSSTDSSYTMEFISGHEATRERSLWPIDQCLKVVTCLSKRGPTGGSLESYLERCEEHARLVKGKRPESIMSRAITRLVKNAHLMKPGFCHGDLTLENVLVSKGSLILIDPNNKQGLFRSPSLDHGKLLQSTHARYHFVFDSHYGGRLHRQASHLESQLRLTDEWEAAMTACISHVIRLRRYQVGKEHLADDILEHLLQNY